MADIKSLAEKLVNLSVKDVNELANILKDEYGIEPAAAAVVSTAASSGGSDSSEATEEKSNFDIILKSAGASKLAIVKLVKEISYYNWIIKGKFSNDTKEKIKKIKNNQ